MSRISHHKQTANSTTNIGFWIYLMTDCVLFATLFATFALFRFAGHKMGNDVSLPVDLNYALILSLVLLFSSATSAMAVIKAKEVARIREILGWLCATGLLGLVFLCMELKEFSHLVDEGFSWKVNAANSSFFTLVGTHGLHITIGLIWLSVLFVAILKGRSRELINKKLETFSTYWHFLDIIWIFIFAVVYALGAIL